MAKETTSPFRTPEMVKKEEDDDKPRRNSAGKVMSSNSGQKELPRYLRASTGSCHDLCKYGRKHVSEEKPWKRSKDKKTVNKLPDGMNVDSSPGSSGTEKKSMEVKKKQVVGCLDNASEIIKRKSTSSRLSSSPNSGIKTSGNADTQNQKFMSRSLSGQATLKAKETKQTHGQVSSPGMKPVMRKAGGGKDSDVKMEKKIGASKVDSKKEAVAPRASFSGKASMRVSGNSSLRKSQSLKLKSSILSTKPMDGPEPLDGDPVVEKTLHVVEMVAEHDLSERCIIQPSTEKHKNVEEYDEITVSEAEEHCNYPSGSNETESAEEEGEGLDGENKQRGRSEGDSSEEARKLRFRRGKVLDVNSENESPRRLKFRQGRTLGEEDEQNGNERRSFKRREDPVDVDDDDDSGEKVVLRHQDVQDKKDTQGLFNNVIEETASKLAETRISKVKALVGAFETVISLQESKPSATSGT